MMGTMNCIYETPCHWCSKWDKRCDCKIGVVTNSPTPCTSYRDGRCIATLEKDPCNCHGDQARCDFYDYIREGAKKAGV